MFTNIDRIRNTGLALLFLCILLMALHTFQGARVTRIIESGNPAETILTFEVNNNLNEENELDIQIVPSAPNIYSVRGNKIVLTITEPLKSSTNYQITINNIVDTRGKKSTAKYEKRTPDQSYAVLQRNINGVDKIIKKTIGNQNNLVLFENDTISDFAIGIDNTVLAISEEKTDRLSTILYRIKNGIIEVLTIPSGFATGITADPKSELFFIQTRDSDLHTNKLFSYNLSSKLFTELLNDDGSSIHSADIHIASDKETIVYQTADKASLEVSNFIDNKPPLIFGTVENILRLSPNDSFIFVESSPGEYNTIQSDGSVANIEVPPTTSNITMTNSRSLVLINNLYSLGENSRLELLLNDTETSSVLYNQPINEGSLSHLSISQNDEFISTEQSVQPIIYDNYKINPRPQNAKLLIFSLHEKRKIESIEGVLIQWL